MTQPALSLVDPGALALARLRDPGDDAALGRLVDLILDDLAARPAADLLAPASTVALVHDALRAWAASAAIDAQVAEEVTAAADRLARHPGPASTLAAPQLLDAARAIAGRPYSPDREVVLALLDREPVRRLLRELLVQTLIAFGRKLRSSGTEGLAKSFGGLGRLAAGQMKALGSLASGVASAVGGEFERQLEVRSAEFADAALSKMLQGLADQASDPAHAVEQAALRTAILDGLLGLTGAQVAQELRRADPAGAAAIAREAVGRWLDEPRSREDLERALAYLLERAGEVPLGPTLARLGLEQPARRLARLVLLHRLRPIVEGDAFATWLAALLSPGGAGGPA